MMKRSMPLFITAMALLIVFGVLLWVLPARDFSELENRTLAALPAASQDTLLNGAWGEALEAYAADHFPLREAMVAGRTTLHRLTGDVMQQNAIAGRDGWLFEPPQQSVSRVASLGVQALNDLAEALALPSALMIVPTSADVMQSALPALYACQSQRPVLEALYALAPAMTPVDSTLLAHEGESSLYYRTDHHLTADGAAVCYRALCASLSLEPQAGTRTAIPGMQGSYFARMPGPLTQPELFTVDLPGQVTVTLDGAPADFLDAALLEKRNKYAALFRGTYAHVVLENPQGSGSLLLVCDSYANAIAPMLAANYARVDMIDPRYYTGDLAQLADEAQTTQLLGLYGLNIISTNRSLLLMDIPERRTDR